MKNRGTTLLQKMMTKVIATMLLVSTMAGLLSCSGGGSSSAPPQGSGGPSAAALAAQLTGPYSAASVTAAITVLSQAGLNVVNDDGSVPVAKAVSQAAAAGGGLSLIQFQARALALETAGGGGYLGSDLDKVTPPIPLPPDGTGIDKQITFSLLIAAYVKTADTLSAQVARGLMGDLDLTLHTQYRYPSLVLYTFMQEVMVPLLAEMEAAEAPVQKGRVRKALSAAMAAPGFDPADPCGSINAFLDDLSSTVTGAVNSLGGTTSSIWNSIVSVTAVVAGVATGIATDVARGIVRHNPAVRAMRAGMTGLHALADLNAMFSQWNITVAADLGTLHKIPGTPTAGVFTVTLNNGGGDTPAWPDAVQNCATLFAIPLPDFNSADGATVTWQTIAGFNALAIEASQVTTLANNKATFNFNTAVETQEVHDDPGSKLKQGTATVQAKVSIPGLENLMNALASNLSTVASLPVNGAAAPVSQLAGLTKTGSTTVEYHSPGPVTADLDGPFMKLHAYSCNGLYGIWTGTFTEDDPVLGVTSATATWQFDAGNTAVVTYSRTRPLDCAVITETRTWSLVLSGVPDSPVIDGDLNAAQSSYTYAVDGSACDPPYGATVPQSPQYLGIAPIITGPSAECPAQ